MSNIIALVREPSPSFVNALSEHPKKESIQFARALDQHRQYVLALHQLGVDVMLLDPLEDFPDSVFLEDTAVVTNEVAFLCSFKEESRRGEITVLLPELEKFRKVEVLKPPIFVDGGDVLQTEDTVFMGLSRRTNREAVDFFRSRLDRKVVPVPVTQSLHLKSAATYLGKKIIVADELKVDTSAFSGFEIIQTGPNEQYGANSLAVGDRVILPAGFPKLSQILRDRGFEVFQVGMSEFEKADGGVTCLSVIIARSF